MHSFVLRSLFHENLLMQKNAYELGFPLIFRLLKPRSLALPPWMTIPHRGKAAMQSRKSFKPRSNLSWEALGMLRG